MDWLRTTTILFLTSVICVFGGSIVSQSFSKAVPCNQGQAYWCHNVRTAVSCSALKHCIQSVWEREVPIEKDKSEVCQICLDMVKQARNQLQSNETQEEIKAVLEGSCMLIPIEVVKNECVKLMDEFAPQIVDVLSSQMNPQVVCSVAGLCNNERIHQLEYEYKKQVMERRNKKTELTCGNCHGLMHIIRENLDSSSRDNILEFFVELCGFTGSYSDGCAALVMQHINTIQYVLKRNLHEDAVCSLAGVCKETFHNHNKPQVAENILSSRRGDIMVNGDLPCDLCVQLVAHLKNIMIANTTEQEFKLVLKGLCSQMTTYKNECLSLIDEYYVLIYDFLVNELNGKLLCEQMGLCPKPNNEQKLLRPLVPADIPSIPAPKEVEQFQLPVERYNPLTPITLVPSSFMSGTKKSKELCAMCEYFLHFVQQEITLPSSEKKIKDVVMKGCERLPKAVAAECDSFVQTYMDAFIALLANRIDPSQVCPSLGVCPGDLVAVEYKDKPTCPLCLFAMQEVINKVQLRTVDEINDIIDNLCLRDVFPNSLSTECVKFITDNRQAIVDMVVTEFTPQESCVYIDLCVAPDLRNPTPMEEMPVGNIETNEISDVMPHEQDRDSSSCALCEFFMTKLDSILEDKKTEDEIKQAVYKVCAYMPKTLSTDCKRFVTEYADIVIELLAQELDPKEVCTAINLCGNASSLIKDPMERCLLCELLMDGLQTVLTDKNVDNNINRNLEKACFHVPMKEQRLCLSLIEELAPQVEAALRTLPVGPAICKRIHMCEYRVKNFVPILRESNCLRGSSYWCQSTITAAACGNIEYCQQEVWKGLKPKINYNKGRIVIRN